jgi:hypothetical protein
MSYNEEDLEQYSIYMLYVENEVDKCNVPKYIKKQMFEKRNLHKRSNAYSWFLEEQGYEVDFLPFTQWLLQNDRDKKLEQLLND